LWNVLQIIWRNFPSTKKNRTGYGSAIVRIFVPFIDEMVNHGRAKMVRHLECLRSS